jgi:DNA-damage-inducible protein J
MVCKNNAAEIRRKVNMTDHAPYIDDSNKELQDKASEVLASIGLTVNEAFHLFLLTIAKDKEIIYDFLTPNAETVEAMQELQNGGGATFNTLNELLEDLERDE